MKRLPDFLRRGIINTDATKNVRMILKNKCLNTVCESARCPNKNECYTKNTATFLIMGTICTRNCRFCNIQGGVPTALDISEPHHIAEAVKELNLKYVVITSVTRDDLKDQGAEHFANVINETRKLSPNVKIEVLTPDFQGYTDSIDTVLKANPDVFNHNIETVPELYKKARPMADYKRSLDFLKYIKEKSTTTLTKTGLMVGLGENIEQIESVFTDLKDIHCDIVTIGQYIQPSKNHLEVEKYYTIEEYEMLTKIAKKIGIKHTSFSPLTRSSYNALEIYNSNTIK
ncbi:MAG: lipoyl synthase [Candidatus Gastranaerophilales bacterium]|nr:lipoyl synthase [Candidatus Gastranaerophilales bacterium]